MRWVLRIGVFAVLVGVGAALVVQLSQFSPHEIRQPPADMRPVEQAPAVPPPPIGAQWRYIPQPGGGEEACTRAQGDVTLGANAQSAVLLCLRRGGFVSIALADRSGRFGCGDCQLRASFDGAPRGLSGSTASTDGTAFTIFLADPAGVASDVKRAATLTVTLPVRGAGDQTATFDVAGLRWN